MAKVDWSKKNEAKSHKDTRIRSKKQVDFELKFRSV